MSENTDNNDDFYKKFDSIYGKIAYCLSLDARVSMTKLSKITGISASNVKYRIQNLLDRDFYYPITLINDTRLGLISVMICVKLKKVHNKNYDLLFTKFPQLRRYKECSGVYDLLFWFNIVDVSQLQRLLERISAFLGKDLDNYDVLFIETEDVLGLKMLTKDYPLIKDQIIKTKNGYGKSKYNLNRYESHMINTLKQKPLINIAKLATEIKASVNTTKKYYSKLNDAGILKSITISPNMERFGFLSYNMFVKINNSKKKEFENYIDTESEIWWRKKLVGRWDYDLSVAVKDNAEFINLMTRMRNKMSSIIIDSGFIMNKDRKISLRFKLKKSPLDRSIIMLCGLPYSGKTTLCNTLKDSLISEGTQGHAFSTTDYRLRDGLGIMNLQFYDNNNTKYKEIRDQYADELAEDTKRVMRTGGEVVVLDSTFSYYERRKKIYDLASTEGFNVIVVHLKKPNIELVDDALQNRISSLEFNGFSRDESFSYLKKRYSLQKSQFSPPSVDEAQKHKAGLIIYSYETGSIETLTVPDKLNRAIKRIVKMISAKNSKSLVKPVARAQAMQTY